MSIPIHLRSKQAIRKRRESVLDVKVFRWAAAAIQLG